MNLIIFQAARIYFDDGELDGVSWEESGVIKIMPLAKVCELLFNILTFLISRDLAWF